MAELEGNLDTAGWQTFELIKKLSDEHQATAQEILTDLKESRGKDEHVVELAPVLKSAQTQAMRLLEKAVEKKPVAPPSDTPPQVAPPPIKPPATPLPRPGGALVDEGIADGSDLSKAKDKFAALKGRQREDPPHSCADQLARRGEEGLMAAVALGMRSTVRNQP